MFFPCWEKSYVSLPSLYHPPSHPTNYGTVRWWRCIRQGILLLWRARVSPGTDGIFILIFALVARCCDRFAHIDALFDIQGQYIPEEDTQIDNQAEQISWKHNITRLLPCIPFITWILLNSKMATSPFWYLGLLILKTFPYISPECLVMFYVFPFRNDRELPGRCCSRRFAVTELSELCFGGPFERKIILLQVKDRPYTPWN